jgi:hypothetical protein
MDEDFKPFLLEKDITEVEYNRGTLDDKAKLVEAFVKSKQGKTSFIALIR